MHKQLEEKIQSMEQNNLNKQIHEEKELKSKREDFENRKEEISARIFGTQSTKHCKVERIMAQGDFLVTGSAMRFVHKIEFNDGIDQYRLTPE